MASQREEDLGINPFLTWTGPHTITIPRINNGFGFTLRHFIVYPPESPLDEAFQFFEDEENKYEGLRDRNSKCGLEPMDTIFVKNVKEGGPAQLAGLNTGDRIVSVNGETVNGKSYSQVISLIQSSDNILKLSVVPRDEDILQMAYQGSLGLEVETHPKTSNQTSPYRTPSIDENSAPADKNLPPKRRDTPYKFESTYDFNPRASPNWKNFYASDSRVHRQPLRNDDSDNKGMSYRDRKLDRPVSEDSGGKMASISCNLPSKNTYSYGLIIPPKDDSKSNSVDNLTHTSSVQYSRENSKDSNSRPRRLGYENRQQSCDSDSQTDNKGTSRHSYTEPTSFIISRSKTTSALSNTSNRQVQAPCSMQWNASSRSGDSNGESVGNKHFVPVVSESHLGKGNQFSTSVDSIDLRTGRYIQERQWQPNKVSNRERERERDSGSSGRTFVVRIPVSDRQHVVTSDSQNISRSGTTFALTRSPVTQIEIHKGPSRPIVSHRKQQFEEGKNENIPPHGVNLNKRYRTELEKLSSLKKFSSVANRAAHFEGKSDASGTNSSDENSSPPLGTRSRKSSDQYCQPEITHKAERPNTISKYSESAPIRIYVSPGSSSAPSSPIVEIVPLFPDQSSGRESNQRPTSYPQNASDEQYEDGFHARIIHENLHNSRPVRKTSYLSAVNAPRTRYQEDGSPESPGALSSVLSSSDGSVVISRVDSMPSQSASFPSSSMDPANDPVKIRKKNAASSEEEMLKLHRRTSYLMATAKDRSNLNQNQSIEKTFLPPQTDEDQQTPPNRNQTNLKKLKNFFGEKTPSILEATEPQANDAPESPLPHVTKEGSLLCKTAVTDGKKSSDRSWRPLWVVLRGHALYLCKDKKEGVHTPNFEDQPISIKSCLIDIAHDYAKKKRNVFRLSTFNGSEYLFQTVDRGTLMSWIQAIKTNNDPDCDEQSVASSDLISRKITAHELSQVPTKSSPQVAQKGKKLSGLKKLTGSPSLRRKKTGEKEESKSKSWKMPKMPKSFKRSQESSSQIAVENEDSGNKTFGVYLKDCIPSPHNEYVPLIVELCARIVEARGLEVIGVYRVPGNSISVNAMQEDLNKGIENISIDNEKWLDVNVISSLLKAFFRKLPESLITDKSYDLFISTNRIEKPVMRMLKLKRLIHTLPDHHFETLKYMANHLNKVASFGNINKMDAKNLAIMFGPTLIRKSDDDTLSMVTDMSDQCRIVESIILHCDWFFSSWDQDDHVPLEENIETSPPTSSADTSRVLKDDDEELDSQINAREIVSSIITAANRKMKSKETSKSCDELDICPPAYSDLDLSRRQGPPPPYSQSQSKLSGMSTSEEFLDRKAPRGTVPVYHRKPPPPPPAYEDEWNTVFQKMDANTRRGLMGVQGRPHYSEDSLAVEGRPHYREENVGVEGRPHYSEDSLLGENDEVHLTHNLNSSSSNNWSLSRDTLDRLKKIKQDTSLIIEREEKRRQDLERRRLEQQLYEREYQRTKKEMELEAEGDLEDLFNLRFAGGDFTNNRPGNTGSSQNQGYLLARAHPVRCGSNSDQDSKPESQKQKEEDQRILSQQQQKPDSGKYFVSIGNRARHKTHSSAMQGSVDCLAQFVPRAGSLENMLDHNHHMHARISDKTRYRRSRDYDQDYNQERSSSHRRRHNTLNRNSTYRHGSLDSLIDLIDKNENRNSWASTDSEDGLDLLTDLTTTFDQKLQILSNPKYKLNGSSRKSRTNSSSASVSTTSDVLDDDKDLELSNSPDLPPPINEHTKPQPVILPRYPQNLLMSAAMSQDNKFQDPSLHRSHKPETKIGIASRFERNPQIATCGAVSSSTPSGPISLVQWTCSNPDTAPFISKKCEGKAVCKNADYLYKTDKNEAISEKYGDKAGKDCAIKQTEKNDSNSKSKSESPPRTEKKSNVRGKRRHTVGGVDDWDNMKALILATSGKDQLKASAWEQLRPAIKEDLTPRNRNLNSWLRQERLRGSTPDLSTLGSLEIADKSFYL